MFCFSARCSVSAFLPRVALLPAAALCSQEGSQKFTIAPGECKSFCTCGLSKNFPLCALFNAHRFAARPRSSASPAALRAATLAGDGSHKAHNAAHGTSFKSIKVEVEEHEPAKDVWICRCAHSKNKPFCDGSHKKIKAVPL